MVDTDSNTITVLVHPRRWVDERNFAWINRGRRLAKDFERPVKSAAALIYAAAAIVLIRCIARYAEIQDSL